MPERSLTLRIIRNRVSGWQNADVQGLCTLFRGWQGWQEGVRCWRTQHKNGWKQVLLLPPRPMAITARDEDAAFTAFEFSGEFGALEPIKQTFATDKTLNSLENSVLYLNLAFTPSHSLSGFGHLSPSCHPCHPWKRVHMPCTSVFCHPDTLKRKIPCIEKARGDAANDIPSQYSTYNHGRDYFLAGCIIFQIPAAQAPPTNGTAKMLVATLVFDVALNNYSSSGKYLERKPCGSNTSTLEAKSKCLILRVTRQSATACSAEKYWRASSKSFASII